MRAGLRGSFFITDSCTGDLNFCTVLWIITHGARWSRYHPSRHSLEYGQLHDSLSKSNKEGGNHFQVYTRRMTRLGPHILKQGSARLLPIRYDAPVMLTFISHLPAFLLFCRGAGLPCSVLKLSS